MNNITKRNRIMKLIDSFSAFVPHCDTPEDKSKLVTEIARMQREINWIKCMGLSELQTQVPLYTHEFESKLNFMDEVVFNPVNGNFVDERI